MKLSIIIVNYNVKFFLEQALLSVEKATRTLSAEVFVVDNNSVDGSVEMLKEKFPNVRLIANKDNTGFSKANNQAIKISTGEYVLLLNPDTVVEEDTFEKVIRFMDSTPDAGGLGVKMLDGTGKFLPESKRGLPTPMVAFHKIFGLSALFPSSKLFGGYHLGYLDKDQIHEVDVLSGAFMLIRKKVLDKIGLLDEQFFMYGEDIDLSYRIQLGGFKNYYFPETRIIHYKGESTKKSSVNYVFVFYKAMVIFAQKHFSQQNAKLFSFFIHFAIFLRAFIALLSRFAMKIMLPLLDGLVLFGGVYFLKNYWEETVKQAVGLHYPDYYIEWVVPLYILVWLASIYFSGGYDKPIRIFRIIRGIFAGTIIILVAYALLPETMRFSRAIIVLGTVWAVLSLSAFRFALSLLKIKEFSFAETGKKRTIIVGGKLEADRVSSLLQNSGVATNIIGFVEAGETHSRESGYLGMLHQLPEIMEVYHPDELIFCSKSIASGQIIDQMAKIRTGKTEFKIAPPESLFIIGSSSVDNAGDIYTIGLNTINLPVNKRNKRVFDLLFSILFLCCFPILVLLSGSFFQLLLNILNVLFGKNSWVGYEGDAKGLPKIKKGILFPSDALSMRVDASTTEKLDMLYAKDYKVYNDLNIALKAIRKTGRKP